MRVSSISVAQPRNLNYKMRTANVKNVQTQPESMQPAFKGWKGSLGYLAGTVIGGTVGTIISGGLFIPFILAGTGAIAGGEYGKSKEDNNGDDYQDRAPYYPNCTD